MNYEDRVTKEYVEGLLERPGQKVLIGAFTSEEDLTCFSVDVREIDFSKYVTVEAYCYAPENTRPLELRFNGLTTPQYHHCSSVGANDVSLSKQRYWGVFRHNGAMCGRAVFFTPQPTARLTGTFSSIQITSECTWENTMVAADSITWEQLTSIDLGLTVGSASGAKVPAGVQLRLYGVLK